MNPAWVHCHNTGLEENYHPWQSRRDRCSSQECAGLWAAQSWWSAILQLKRFTYGLFCLIVARCRAEKKMKWASMWDPACSLGQGCWGIRFQEKEDRHLRESLSSQGRLAVIIGYLSRGVSIPHKEIWFQDLESWAPPHCPTSKQNKNKNEGKIYSY